MSRSLDCAAVSVVNVRESEQGEDTVHGSVQVWEVSRSGTTAREPSQLRVALHKAIGLFVCGTPLGDLPTLSVSY